MTESFRFAFIGLIHATAQVVIDEVLTYKALQWGMIELNPFTNTYGILAHFFALMGSILFLNYFAYAFYNKHKHPKVISTISIFNWTITLIWAINNILSIIIMAVYG